MFQKDPSRHDLEILVRKCKAGDQRAWSDLVERFQRLVYSTARRCTDTQEDAEEVFQTTFVRLHQSLQSIDDPKGLGKWLCTTAAREAFRVTKASRRATPLGEDERTLEETLADEDESAETVAIELQDAVTVRAALEQLGTKCRKLLEMLFVLDDVPYQQISDELGMAIGSIGPTRARCLEQLRSKLADNGFFEPMYQTQE